MTSIGIRVPVAASALAAVVLLAGCGGSSSSNSGDTKKADSPSPSAPASTSAAPARTLKDTCPMIEAAMRAAGSADWLLIPDSGQAAQLSTELDRLADEGDDETKNAIALLNEAVEPIAIAEPENGQPYVEASQALTNGLQGIADRCRTVGSSALQ